MSLAWLLSNIEATLEPLKLLKIVAKYDDEMMARSVPTPNGGMPCVSRVTTEFGNYIIGWRLPATNAMAALVPGIERLKSLQEQVLRGDAVIGRRRRRPVAAVHSQVTRGQTEFVVHIRM